MTFVLGLAVVGVVTFFVNPERIANFQPFMPHGWWKLLGSMGVIYVAFEGFEVIAQAGDETVDPKRNIPKAMLYSVMIVTLTYVVVAFATVVSVSPENVPVGMRPWEVIARHQDKGFRMAANSLMPWGLGGLIVTLAVIFSSTSALNATIYSATRASYALGRDRMLPSGFSSISAKRKTPVVALAFTAGIVLIAAGLLTPKHGAATASIMFLFLFFLVNLCVIKIRRNMGDELEYGYVMPLFPLFPILAIACQAGLAGGIIHESMVAWIIGPAWVLAGIGIYLFYARHHAVTTEDEILVLSQDQTGPEPEQAQSSRVMVSVANPDNALSMVRTTYQLCRARKAPKVDLLHMVPVPPHVPLSEAESYMVEGKEGILETMLYLAPMFPITTHMRYCRNISRGIISACREKRIRMLIMGWHGRPNSGYFHMGSTIDPILERAPCDVVVLKDTGGNRTFQRVLVPLAGGPNSALALEIASILADQDQGRVTCFHIAGGRRKFDVNEFLEQNESRLHLPAERLEVKIVPRRPIVEGILAESEQYDLVVLGSTRDSILRKMTHTPVPETIARRCSQPVVMTRAGSGVRSWIRRWI
jgi:nucleotide-binding universal stress UspA family protein